MKAEQQGSVTVRSAVTEHNIINMPHHQSACHPHMTLKMRAAQFSPFAALTGYEDIVQEAGRLTQSDIELAEDEQYLLNLKLQYIHENFRDIPSVTFLYFIPDKRKSGGEYASKSGRIKKFDSIENVVIFEDGEKIFVSDIVEVSTDD